MRFSIAIVAYYLLLAVCFCAPTSGQQPPTTSSVNYDSLVAPVSCDGLLCDSAGGNAIGDCLNDVDGFPCLCDPTPCGNKNWLDIDFVSFWNDGFRTPALASTSPAGTPQASSGVLPGATTVIGNGRIGDDALNGFRIGYGHWLDDCGNCAITGSLFFLNNDDSTMLPGDPNTLVSRPFFNATTSDQDSELVNFPGAVAGTMTVATGSDIFSGTFGIQKKVCCSADSQCCHAWRIQSYIGYRHFSLDEALTISEALSSSLTDGFLPVGTEIAVTDSFRTRNDFNGVEVGFSTQMQKRRWVLGATTRVGVGNIHQQVRISGLTTTTVPGFDPAVQPYGFLAAPSNIGTYDRNKFGVTTDTRLEIGYWLNDRWKLQLGYNLFFLSNVVRPGDFVSTTLNTTQIDPNAQTAGDAVPEFAWRDDSLLLHGLSLGAELRF